MTLTLYRTAVRRLLGDEQNDSGDWPDDLIDEGLRGGLATYAQVAPLVEADHVVSVAGREQDLRSVDSDLQTVVSVAWPWEEGASYAERVVRTEQVGHGVIRVVDGAPQIGDLIRVRYVKRRRIEGLDAAAATTIPDAHSEIVVVAAAARACAVRMRQLSALPSAPADEVEHLRELRGYFENKADELAVRLLLIVDRIAWGDIGL